MQDGRRLNVLVVGFRADGLETVLERCDKRGARRARVAGVDDTRGLGEVNLDRLDERVERVDETGGRVDVGERGGVSLPAGLEHLAARVDELNAIVLPSNVSHRRPTAVADL